MRDGFVFYRSWLEAVKNLPRDIQGEVLTAIIEYGLYGETTDNLKPIATAMLAMVKPQIDVNNRRYENGKKGGRPSKSETKAEPNKNQVITEQKPSNNQTETKAEPKEKDKDNDIKETTTKVVAKKTAAKAATLTERKRETLSRKEKFYESLVPYLDRYPKSMIREFFDYWSEMNKSCTKMKWEQQSTWELKLRLANWANRQKEYLNGSNKNTTKQEANEYAMQKLAERIEQREQGLSSEIQNPW